jgi:hypothetical protein
VERAVLSMRDHALGGAGCGGVAGALSAPLRTDSNPDRPRDEVGGNVAARSTLESGEAGVAAGAGPARAEPRDGFIEAFVKNAAGTMRTRMAPINRYAHEKVPLAGAPRPWRMAPQMLCPNAKGRAAGKDGHSVDVAKTGPHHPVRPKMACCRLPGAINEEEAGGRPRNVNRCGRSRSSIGRLHT